MKSQPPKTTSHIKIWLWEDAPESYRRLIEPNGDEKCVVHIPKELNKQHHPVSVFMDTGDCFVEGFGWCQSPIKTTSGTVLIFNHG